MGQILANTHDGPQNRGSFPFGAALAQRPLQVDKSPGAMLRWLMLHLNGTVVVSAGTTSGTSIGENPGNLVQQVRYVAPSKGGYPGGDIIRLGARSLIRSRLFDKSNIITDAALTGAAGTFTLDQPLWLRFQNPDSPRPFDSALPMDAYQSHGLVITNGNRDTQFAGNDRTFDFTGTLYDLIDSREVQAEGTRSKTIIFRQDDPYLVAAANKRFVVNTFPVDGAVTDLTIFSESTANQTLVNTIVNNVIARFGGIPFANIKGSQIQRVERDRFLDSSQSVTGIYNLGFNEDQLLKAGLPIQNQGDLALEFDVSNPGGANLDRLLIMTERAFVPPTSSTAASA